MRGPAADRAAVGDMLGYALRVRDHVGSRRDLDVELNRHAALYELAILGEAANRTSPELRASHPDVPWARIVAFRTIIIHGYERVDLDRVWEAVDLLDGLDEQLGLILEGLPDG